jgi:hypothetical protein
MMNGRNNGKKLMAVRIVQHSFEIVCRPPFNVYLLHTILPYPVSSHISHKSLLLTRSLRL